MLLEITKLGEEILREKAQPVAEVNDEIRQLAEDMFETMIEADGVGLACPQINKNLRMFVVIADDDVRRVFINPQIIKTSEELGDYDEGCLSIPQVYETIRRPVRVTVQALNEKGKPFTLEADGLLARIIQHEYDHLEGIVFIDRGDKSFAEKTEAQFKKRAERAAEKAKEKAARQAKIAAKIAAKEAKKAKNK
ncbi:MAG: peptide deformylase [Treponema sp.]|nr:peptide deformylase [Spirochaetia bacterium]MDY2840486.1 peptide deformylase [Treponema sp.]MDY5124457.1 peptide deformylase [Treponema sp.]